MITMYENICTKVQLYIPNKINAQNLMEMHKKKSYFF